MREDRSLPAKIYRITYWVLVVGGPIVLLGWSAGDPDFYVSWEEQATRYFVETGAVAPSEMDFSSGPAEWAVFYGALVCGLVGLLNMLWPVFCARAVRYEKFRDDPQGMVRQTRIAGAIMLALAAYLTYESYSRSWWWW